MRSKKENEKGGKQMGMVGSKESDTVKGHTLVEVEGEVRGVKNVKELNRFYSVRFEANFLTNYSASFQNSAQQ